ncbi:MAG: hypothetical protein ACI4J1_03405 [Ruminiclostridium sp.]
MANSIALFKNYTKNLDEVYKNASATSVLDARSEEVQMGRNAGEFLIPVISMDGLGDYGRTGGGYAAGNVTMSFETKKCNYDRGRKFHVDAMDEEESAGIAFGKLSSEFIRTKVVPEMDAFRFATYAGKTGILTKAAAITTGEQVLAALVAATNELDENEVPAENRHLFITPTLYTAANSVDLNKSRAILDRFTAIHKVPQTRFYTGIDLLDGKSDDELAGGYAQSTGAFNINFMIIHKDAVIQFGKHNVNKAIRPEDNQESDDWLFFYRAYSIAEVYDNKLKGIYLHRDTTAKS